MREIHGKTRTSGLIGNPVEHTMSPLIHNFLAEEMGIDTNTVCRWVRDYRRKYNLPTYAEEKGIRTQPPKDSIELKQRIKDLEAKLKEKEKELEQQKQKTREEQEKIEILKKSLHIFMQVQE